MSIELVLTAVFKKEAEGGYSVFCPELGVASQGETVEEAEANLKEACELYLESAKELGILDKILEEVTGGGREATPVLTGSVKVKI
ncbi:MAG: type II toxin-antitoxin system HicB family antitoxin [Thermoproteota archaeon]|uniref:type II toxin-antitoxin system HicB family antitoxin n=1 Tax=Thermofilum sp. TaxID=1961369 RepID=UPI00315F8DF7|nr:type II toxin-antitoxin system HicB family antitoxin [Candidatus Brockarchaeota archaeon]